MTDYGPLIITTHAYCGNNRADLLAVKVAACFHCCTRFPRTRVMEWCDGGETALCPRCGIDAVLPDPCHGLDVTAELLHEMNKYWFAPAPHLTDER